MKEVFSYKLLFLVFVYQVLASTGNHTKTNYSPDNPKSEMLQKN